MPAISSKTDARLQITFKDQDGAFVDLTQLDCCRGSVINLDDGFFLRKSENLLISPDLVLNANGLLTWYLTPWDTQLVGDTDVGDTQTRSAYVRLAWGATLSVGLSNPFTTLADERRVVITHPAHGLIVTDTVFFETDVDVGGLDLGSQFVVNEVIDGNHYAILTDDPATSDATNAGGPVIAWLHGRAASASKIFAVKRDDPL